VLGYFHIIPKSRSALDALARHGDVMGVDRQKGAEVLLWCATPTCPCWVPGNFRYRNWFRLHLDVELGSSVVMSAITDEINQATSVANVSPLVVGAEPTPPVG
jgi:hypothetical protein